MEPLSQSLSAAITLADRFRGPPLDDPESNYKEWLHFCIVTPNVQIIVNFSLARDRRPTAGADSMYARLLLLVCSDGWHGGSVLVPPHKVRISSERIDLSMGPGSVCFQDGHFHIRAALTDPDMSVDLRLRPLVVPVVSGMTRVGSGVLRWVSVPRLLASGEVRMADRLLTVCEAPAYHDHNFGSWRWGEDFAWRWGFALPADPLNPWSLVWSEIGNRAHTSVMDRGVQVYRAPMLIRSFHDAAAAITEHGLVGSQRVRKLPAVMRLLACDVGVDVPAELRLRACFGQDTLNCTYHTEQIAQIFLPSEVDLRWMVINEVTAQVAVSGVINGQTLQFSGIGIFEHVHGSA